MKKLLVTLLVAATSVNFVACGSSNKGMMIKLLLHQEIVIRR